MTLKQKEIAQLEMATGMGGNGADGTKEKTGITLQMYDLYLETCNLKYNDMDSCTEMNGRVLNSFQESLLFCRVEDHFDGVGGINDKKLARRINKVAVQNQYHPIIDFVENLPQWNGADHIKNLAACFISEDESPSQVNRKFEIYLAQNVRKWCGTLKKDALQHEKYLRDHCQSITLVMASVKQGIGKSTSFQWLCPIDSLFRSSGISPNNKDHRLGKTNTMLWEISELGATTRKTDTDALKNFLTDERMRDRKPYDKEDTKKPSICAFGATVNNVSGFLTDTENRRFLVLDLKKIDIKYQEINKPQLYAQAKTLWLSGKADMTPAEMTNQRVENRGHAVESTIEIILEPILEFTGRKEDWVPAILLVSHLQANGMKPLGRDISLALRNLAGEKWIKTKVRKVYPEGSKKRKSGVSGVKLLIED